MGSFQEAPLDKIRAFHEVSKGDTSQDVASLMNDLVSQGFDRSVYPPTLIRHDGNYLLLDGQHRHAAFALLGEQTMPGFVYDSLEAYEKRSSGVGALPDSVFRLYGPRKAKGSVLFVRSFDDRDKPLADEYNFSASGDESLDIIQVAKKELEWNGTLVPTNEVALLGYDMPKTSSTKKSIDALTTAIGKAVKMRVEDTSRVTVIHFAEALAVNALEKVQYRKELTKLKHAIEVAEAAGIVIVTGAGDSRLSTPVLVSFAKDHRNVIVVATTESMLTTYRSFLVGSSKESTFAAGGSALKVGAGFNDHVPLFGRSTYATARAAIAAALVELQLDNPPATAVVNVLEETRTRTISGVTQEKLTLLNMPDALALAQATKRLAESESIEDPLVAVSKARQEKLAKPISRSGTLHFNRVIGLYPLVGKEQSQERKELLIHLEPRSIPGVQGMVGTRSIRTGKEEGEPFRTRY